MTHAEKYEYRFTQNEEGGTFGIWEKGGKQVLDDAKLKEIRGARKAGDPGSMARLNEKTVAEVKVRQYDEAEAKHMDDIQAKKPKGGYTGADQYEWRYNTERSLSEGENRYSIVDKNTDLPAGSKDIADWKKGNPLSDSAAIARRESSGIRNMNPEGKKWALDADGNPIKSAAPAKPATPKPATPKPATPKPAKPATPKPATPTTGAPAPAPAGSPAPSPTGKRFYTQSDNLGNVGIIDSTTGSFG